MPYATPTALLDALAARGVEELALDAHANTVRWHPAARAEAEGLTVERDNG